MSAIISLEVLKERLKTEVLTLHYTKKDGNTRLMTCTLIPEYLPVPKENAVPRDPSTTVLPVWDVEADAWRSVIVENITNIDYPVGLIQLDDEENF